MKEALKAFALIHVEMEPGDALFFHCNLLHSSGSNLSKDRRWALIYSYNLASNSPFLESHNPSYQKLEKVEDAELIRNGIKFADGTEEFQSTYVSKAMPA